MEKLLHVSLKWEIWKHAINNNNGHVMKVKMHCIKVNFNGATGTQRSSKLFPIRDKKKTAIPLIETFASESIWILQFATSFESSKMMFTNDRFASGIVCETNETLERMTKYEK